MATRRYADPLANAGPLGAGVLPFADTGLTFSHCRTYDRATSSVDHVPVADVDRDRLESLAAPKRFAGFGFVDGPVLMGIVNVTPDSFSDGGRFLDHDRAIRHGFALAEAGAGIIDVGGESTRPGAAAVSIDEEVARIEPVVRRLASEGLCVSIDTRNAEVMRAALQAGAAIINDVTALTHDPDALPLAAGSDASVMLMHMQGEPGTMQEAPDYEFAPADVCDYLEVRRDACLDAGIPLERISLDPGIGFGKNDTHNYQILDWLGLYQGLGCALTLGVSRKSFIGRTDGGADADARVPGSLASALAGVRRGAQILRVHDVAETRQALAVWRMIEGSGRA
jgi:dihydropteroate synthase